MDVNTKKIIDYLQNELSVKERKSFEQLLEISPELQKEFNEIRFVWEATTQLNL